ncbi:MAG: preprotein translocase subunit Sec61beta [Candidatus Aenigmarchaeota archaeon]|nr:preprotein translocase subunit Sec61beta [Candidatus Aenigmarchaeota archaeon]MCK5176486.1 preprotein translocase subunit Sec61beta [Candidatus Aenigmarchaeota archaeon]
MAKEKKQLPFSQAGLVNYTGDVKSGIKMKPEYVIIFAVILVFIEIALWRGGL